MRDDVAYTLEAPPALLPFLPMLLADCPALGASPGAVIDALRPLGLPPATRVLGLGCGKGAVALDLASPEEMRAVNRQNMAGIRRRAEALVRVHPEAVDLLRGYVRRQEHECAVLETTIRPAMWLLRRAA